MIPIDSDLIKVSVNTTEDLEVEVDETDDMDLEEAHCKADIYAPLSLNLKMLWSFCGDYHKYEVTQSWLELRKLVNWD